MSVTQFYKIRLSPDELMATSRAVTGIDIVDVDAVEALRMLVKSFNEESQLHEAGASALQNKLLRSLKNRLRMLRDFRNHPEIADQEVKKPIMISGSFRTGSTKLQRMLAASEDFNWLPLWMGLNFASESGVPGEDTAARYADAGEYVNYNARMSPELDAAHNHELLAPEEETFVGNHSLLSIAYFGYSQVPSYLMWASRQDATYYFRFIRDVLKYLQWQGLADPSKRWLLKSPINLGMEAAVKAVFPDAAYVVTHRPPAQTLASLFSLLEKLYKCHTDAPIGDTHQLAAGQGMSMERHIQFRRDNPDFPILDIHYKDATTQADRVIRRIYEFAGESLSSEARELMLAWDKNNPIHKQGSHTYTLEQFGLTPDLVKNLCPDYMRFYDQSFGALAR